MGASVQRQAISPAATSRSISSANRVRGEGSGRELGRFMPQNDPKQYGRSVPIMINGIAGMISDN